MTNALQLATVNSLCGFVLFLSKLGIVAVTVFMGLELMAKRKRVPLVVLEWRATALLTVSSVFMRL